MPESIPFSRPMIIGKELAYIEEAVRRGNLAGDGYFSERCSKLLEKRFDLGPVLLVSSGTSALDLAAAAVDIEPGDEIILPSFTFVATANAFLRLGAKPVFVDVHLDTMTIDETKVAAAITPRTKVICPVHYAGVAAEMDPIMSLAKERGLLVIEDAAQGVDASYRGKPLGGIAPLATYSFHEQKNFMGGQAGAVVVNDRRYLEKIEILRDKGTNRAKFMRGEVAKYVWVEVGVAHCLSELNAAYLCAQLEEMDRISVKRKEVDRLYRELLLPATTAGDIFLGRIPDYCVSNHHIVFGMSADQATRDRLIAFLKERGIPAPFHYMPLHASPVGERYGYQEGDLPVTEAGAARLFRLPSFYDITPAQQERVATGVLEFYGKRLA